MLQEQKIWDFCQEPTLLETKSTTSSALAAKGLALELELELTLGLELELKEIFFQRSLRVEGILPEPESETKGSIDLLKHQFLPLTGNTINLALILPRKNLFYEFRFRAHKAHKQAQKK